MILLTDAAENTQNVNIDWNQLWNTIVNWCMTTGIKLIVGIIVLFLIFKLINLICKKLTKSFKKRKHDETLTRIGISALRMILKCLALICFVGYVGFETASLSAVVASIGVGISLAVQGTLSNFAGGVIIIVMRPFRIGDFITSNGQSGTVEDIKLFYTHLITTDNRTIFIPNGSLANNVIVNASMKETRRLDIAFSVSYDTDINQARDVFNKVLANHADMILVDPAPFVNVATLGAYSVDFAIRVWCKSENYWTLNFALIEELKNACDEAGIEIPFNQLDVNLKK